MMTFRDKEVRDLFISNLSFRIAHRSVPDSVCEARKYLQEEWQRAEWVIPSAWFSFKARVKHIIRQMETGEYVKE